MYSCTSLSDSVAYRADAVLLIILDEFESGLGSSGCGTSTRIARMASSNGEFFACSAGGLGPRVEDAAGDSDAMCDEEDREPDWEPEAALGETLDR